MSMAISRSGIRKFLPGFWNKLPVIACGFQSQLQNSEGAVVPDFAVRFVMSKFSEVLPPRAHDELANPALGVLISVGILRRTPFVVVLVAFPNNLRVGVIHGLPE